MYIILKFQEVKLFVAITFMKIVKTDIKAKVMCYDSKRRNLKPGNLPTIFKQKVHDIINMDDEIRSKRNNNLLD